MLCYNVPIRQRGREPSRTGTEFMRVMGIYRSGALSTRRSPEDDLHLPLYLAFKNLRKYVMEDERLVVALQRPIRYREEGRANNRGHPRHQIPAINP